MGIMRRGVKYPLADCLVIAVVCAMVGWVAHGRIGPVEVDEPVYTDAPPPRGDGPIWEWSRTAGDPDLCAALGIQIVRFGALLPEATKRVQVGLYVDKYAWEEEQRLDSLAVIDQTIDLVSFGDGEGHNWVDNPVDVRVILAPVEGHQLRDAEHA